MKSGDDKGAVVGEVLGEEDGGVTKLLGGGGDGAISEADEEGSREVGGLKVAMALQEG